LLAQLRGVLRAFVDGQLNSDFNRIADPSREGQKTAASVMAHSSVAFWVDFDVAEDARCRPQDGVQRQPALAFRPRNLIHGVVYSSAFGKNPASVDATFTALSEQASGVSCEACGDSLDGLKAAKFQID
jgi:hypothetical protein